ncbi:hypothetical protein [Thioclava nitratireducens]|uniref:hypothetical protein n=1 Tax=Thioclava nitratireducens TaxID=1915078 RepID=UPI00248171AD|nr:hypothetical protein [Thioclava nitratireducens]WGT51377.1 hypothetical protein P0N61_04910 [Thioclava nitratireducens]
MIIIEDKNVSLAASLLESEGVFVDGDCEGPSLCFTRGVIAWETALRAFGYEKALSVGVDEKNGTWLYFLYDEEKLDRQKAYRVAARRAASRKPS